MTKINTRTTKLISTLLSLAVTLAICLSCMAAGIGATRAFAASDEVKQCVTVKQTVNGSPSKTTYTYYLMPMEKGNPMPSSADGGKLENGLYRFTLKENDSAKFYLTFTEPGTYNYELRRTEAVPEDDVVTPTIHPFGYKVTRLADGTLEVIPFTCYDVYMEIRGEDGKPTEIVLANTISKSGGGSSVTPSDGKDGKDGQDGKDGKDGEKGEKGDPGENGTNGIDGKDGANGKNGTNGTNGTNGKDGKTVYVSNGTKTTTGTATRAGRTNTGDPYQIGLWIGLIVVAAGGLIAVAVIRRKKEKDEDKS